MIMHMSFAAFHYNILSVCNSSFHIDDGAPAAAAAVVIGVFL